MTNEERLKMYIEARDLVEKQLSIVDYIDDWRDAQATKRELENRHRALTASIEGLHAAPGFLTGSTDQLQDLFGPFTGE